MKLGKPDTQEHYPSKGEKRKRVLALNSKHNGAGLLFKPMLGCCNCFLKSVATNGKDEHGQNLEKKG